ncbi:MAG: hypothetical protein HC808_18315 [Candidatus Competibacteraceae bacterium]|nr:hypothetical protein [Candidatus Competibacteraceae bacterium]
MRVLTLTAALLFTAITTVTAFAESAIPDLKGEWTMTIEAVIQSNKAELPPKRHVDQKEGFVSVDLVITIDKQEGFKFSGTKSSKQRKEKSRASSGLIISQCTWWTTMGCCSAGSWGPTKWSRFTFTLLNTDPWWGEGS